MTKTDLRNFTYTELSDYIVETFGEKPFRAKQIFEWLYTHNVNSFDDMTSLSKPFRDKLEETCTIEPLKLSQVLKSKDGSEKLQFTLKDGYAVEAVLMPADGRVTLCISSQVGCAMGCQFCFTGSLKLTRNLEAAEIVDQYRQSQIYVGEDRISNIVMMGMGEPLTNFDNVVKACNLLSEDRGYNISGRKITVSTCGIVPKIAKLAEETNVNLAVSLNATTDEARSAIMPINKRYPLEDLIEALRSFPKQRKKRIVLEYVLLGGVNDTMDDARRLARIANRISCKINLIPFNVHTASNFDAPTNDHVLEFQRVLVNAKIDTRIRQSRGQDIYGACGMLGKAE